MVKNHKKQIWDSRYIPHFSIYTAINYRVYHDQSDCYVWRLNRAARVSRLLVLSGFLSVFLHTYWIKCYRWINATVQGVYYDRYMRYI